MGECITSKSMASKTPETHVFIVSYPAQGQINPLLRLGKRIASMGGFLVTFATTTHFRQTIIKGNDVAPPDDHLYPVGRGFLRFDFFDDEWAQADPRRTIPPLFYPHVDLVARKRVPEMLNRLAHEGRPVCCLINGTLLPCVPDIAAELGISCATMWAQSCACFLTFYCRYKNLVSFPTQDDPYVDVEIPTLPRLKWHELHFFLHPAYPRPLVRKAWLAEFANLHKPFCILVDTFDDLEHDAIDLLTSDLCPTIKPVGPLFKDPLSPSSAAIRCDKRKSDSDCLTWLDSKPGRSVVYICFGSTAHIKQEQVDEIAHAILSIGAPFLWVMTKPDQYRDLKPHLLPGGFLDKVGDDGRVVEFSPQEQVLAHPSVSCFVTHCGWNSTMEALSSGVPVVAFPQWGDQRTHAKFLVDVFGVGVRLGRPGDDVDDLHKVVPKEEVEKCIREATEGPKAEQMRRNALAWKEKAEKASQEGGSSYRNLEGFVEEIRSRAVVAL